MICVELKKDINEAGDPSDRNAYTCLFFQRDADIVIGADTGPLKIMVFDCKHVVNCLL